MKALSQITTYTIWAIISLVFGIVYAYLRLAPFKASNEGVGYLLARFYYWGVLHIGFAIGATTAVLFILADIFFLKRILKNQSDTRIARFGVFLGTFVLVIMAHYVLEKVIDMV